MSRTWMNIEDITGKTVEAKEKEKYIIFKKKTRIAYSCNRGRPIKVLFTENYIACKSKKDEEHSQASEREREKKIFDIYCCWSRCYGTPALCQNDKQNIPDVLPPR